MGTMILALSSPKIIIGISKEELLMKKHLLSFVVAGFVSFGVAHSAAPLQETPVKSRINNSDKVFQQAQLKGLKLQLESVKALLEEIRDSASPSFIKSTKSVLMTIIKESLYVATSAVIVGCPGIVVAKALQLNREPELAFLAVPVGLGALIGTYATLKFIFGYLLGSKQDDKKSIAAALDQVNDTLVKLEVQLEIINQLSA